LTVAISEQTAININQLSHLRFLTASVTGYTYTAGWRTTGKSVVALLKKKTFVLEKL
jgi:hypothetical protein